MESEDKKFYEQLIACDNYLYFKNMMVKRNIQIEDEAIKLLKEKTGNQSVIACIILILLN